MMLSFNAPTTSRVAAQRSSPRASTRSVQVRAQAQDASESASSRRQALAGLAFLSLLPTLPAQAYGYKSELCSYQDSEEASDACRKKLIDTDAAKKEDYAAVSERKGLGTVSGVPVPVLDSKYVTASIELMDEIEQYCNADPADRGRIALAKKLKVTALAWVSNYARGGSARSESARKLYIAVDSIIGFLASNGLAPYPKAKAKTTLATVEAAKVFLSEGK